MNEFQNKTGQKHVSFSFRNGRKIRNNYTIYFQT